MKKKGGNKTITNNCKQLEGATKRQKKKRETNNKSNGNTSNKDTTTITLTSCLPATITVTRTAVTHLKVLEDQHPKCLPQHPFRLLVIAPPAARHNCRQKKKKNCVSEHSVYNTCLFLFRPVLMESRQLDQNISKLVSGTASCKYYQHRRYGEKIDKNNFLLALFVPCGPIRPLSSSLEQYCRPNTIDRRYRDRDSPR